MLDTAFGLYSVHLIYSAQKKILTAGKMQIVFHLLMGPVDNFGTVVGENPTPYGILALRAVNGLSIVYWGVTCYEIITL